MATFSDEAYEWMQLQIDEHNRKHPKPILVSLDKACKVFSELLIELCPELSGHGAAAVEWEKEFRKRLEK